MRSAGIGQHLLGHQFRPAIGIDRLPGTVFGNRGGFRRTVGRGSRAEDEMLHPAVDRGLDQCAALHRVVVVIGERVLDRFRNDDRTGKMHDRGNTLLGENLFEQDRVGNIALIERHVLGHGECEAGREIVDHRHRPACIAQGEHRMAADISRPAGHQHGHLVDLAHGALTSTASVNGNALGRARIGFGTESMRHALQTKTIRTNRAEKDRA